MSFDFKRGDIACKYMKYKIMETVCFNGEARNGGRGDVVTWRRAWRVMGKVEMISEGFIEAEMLLADRYSLSILLITKQSPCVPNTARVLKNIFILYSDE